MILIRAHHLLCLQGFQGYGYNKNFVNGMAQVIKDIEQYPYLALKIIDECDVICSYCPYNRDRVCQKKRDSPKRVKAVDLLVLRKLGLKNGARGTPKKLFSLVNRKLKTISDIQGICSDCEWKEQCHWVKNIS
ncbi:DUF1284 domain-containing protein [candidate division WOR-3 bacterium]|nr:DUF1284 domain-containing protein [candidate division WOR-3 bacterium]